ncbi:MAG: hypothetical protein QCI82_12270, partial [Candidatus Thermoplasmatota archaeon]|nr:hypothetical protein [Candidatus Thermoplasmatota archaeon]
MQDRTSVLIKQFKTDISDISFSEGYGSSGNIYPATAGMAPKYHSVDAKLYSERGLGSLSYFDMTVGAKPDGENIVLRYNFGTGRFSKLNDPGRLMVISEDRSNIKLDEEDPNTNMSIHIEFDFNLWWSNYDPVNVQFDLTGAGVAATRRMAEGAFYVESRVRMAGSMLVEDPRGREIRNGGWV